MKRISNHQWAFTVPYKAIIRLIALPVLIGCMAVQLVAQNNLSISFDITPPSCNGYTDGRVNAIVNGGTSPYSYLWSTGSTQSSIFSVTGGSYGLTVTDANGGTASATAVVIEPDKIVLTTQRLGDPCQGLSVGAEASTTGGTAPYTYAWSNGVTGPINNDLEEGPNFVTVTDANGCTRTTSILAYRKMSVDVSATEILCAGDCDAVGRAHVEGGIGPFTYIWNNGMTGPVVQPLGPGYFEVTVTDDQGCTVVGGVVVTEPDSLKITDIDIEYNNECGEDTEATVTVTVEGGTPAYNITWSNGASGPQVTVTPGNYTVKVIDQNGCETRRDIYIPKRPGLRVDLVVQQPNCTNPLGKITANASSGTPPYTYLWSNGEETNMISDLDEGTYTVTVTDAAGCEVIKSATIGPDPKPSLVVYDPICEDGDQTYCVPFTSDGENITVSVGNLTEVTTDSFIVCNIPVGTDVTIIAGNPQFNCKDSKTVTSPTCPQDCPLTVSITTDRDSTCAGEKITLTAVVGNAEGTITYMWFDDADMTNLIGDTESIEVYPEESTTYYLKVSDDCTSATNDFRQASISITVFQNPTVSDLSKMCEDGNVTYKVNFTSDADMIIISAGTLTGPDAANGYMITGVPTSEDIMITAISSEGCEKDVMVDAPQNCPCPITLDLTASKDTICVGETVKLTAEVQDAIGDITYMWATNLDFDPMLNETEANIEVNPDESTTYYVKVVDSCLTTIDVVLIDSVTITVIPNSRNHSSVYNL